MFVERRRKAPVMPPQTDTIAPRPPHPRIRRLVVFTGRLS
jgi:hypothetical protein